MRFLLLFLCVYSKLFAQNVDFDKGSIEPKNYFEEVAYELVNDKIIVPVNINGKIYKFLLDTGAPNVISKKLFEELSLVALDSVKIKDANNLIQSMGGTIIPSIKIGSLKFENQIALVQDIAAHNFLSCFKIDGIIGSNLLRRSILKISTSEKKIYITNKIKNLNPKTKPSQIILIGSQKSPFIKLNFVGKNNEKGSDSALIDTGMDGYYNMSNRAFTIFEDSQIFENVGKAEGVSSIGIFGVGKPSLQRLLKVETARINNTSIKNLLIETTNDTNSRIGLEFLNHGDLIIDFKDKKAYFESNETLFLEIKVPKFSPTVIENKFVIGIVWDENLAKQIRSGDEILSIDSINTSEMSLCDILRVRDEFKNKKSFTINIKNKENAILSLFIEN